MIDLIRKTRKGLMPCLALAWALYGASSCSKDAAKTEDPNLQVEEKTSPISLSMEVSVDDESFRALEYKLEKNTKEQLVPMPKLTDGQKVPVHTMIKSNKGQVASKTVQWTYHAETKTLSLRHGDSGNEFILSNFNHEEGRKWYVTGMIGGSLGTSDHTVIVSPIKDLKAISNLNDELGSYDIPYAFPWTELELHVTGEKEGSSYKQAYVTPVVTFKPQGAFIKYQLGNMQEDASKPTFTPSGFTVSSNDFGDQGKFKLNTTPKVGGMPEWVPEVCGAAMTYNLVGNKEVIAHGAKSDKYYYAWVMPENKDIIRTTVIVRGETTGETSLTKAFFTDYKAAKQKNTKSGRVHLLSASVSKPVYIPAEYVTEYNLAGGPTIQAKPLAGEPAYPGSMPSNALRFANRNGDNSQNTNGHNNNMSGYYHWNSVKKDASPNEDLRNWQLIDSDGQTITLKDKYRIPELDDYWGIFPAPYDEYRNLKNIGFNWDGKNNEGENTPLRTKCSEHMKVGDDTGGNRLLQIYSSEYSMPYYPNGSHEAGDAIVYALRFMKQKECKDIEIRLFSDDPNRYYSSAPDNTMACAYRYHRVGTPAVWDDRKSMTHHLLIDVVYLGETVTSMDLNTISKETWWDQKRAENKVYTLTFPAALPLQNEQGTLSQVRDNRHHAKSVEFYYWAALRPSENPGSGSRMNMTGAFVRGGYFMTNYYKLPVRLFKQKPESKK
ncbi:MAG: hypothetical protein Q4A64_03645 [Porphyromonadaceae bacterium]|nr:hypothetical protein [Porphyromonadaceae bacterium]